MAYGSRVAGDKKVIDNLEKAKYTVIGRIAVAVEKTLVDVANHAKAHHRRNEDPHAQGRFISQTGTLIRSITQGLSDINENYVEGYVATNIEYAAFVELGTSRSRPYPYLQTALIANIKKAQERINKAAKL
jgi:HK97 gp10 family phage protein